MDAVENLREQVREFAKIDVKKYLDAGGEQEYPASLIASLRQMGVFGINVPREYGGMELPRHAPVVVSRELASGWQSLAALLGTHWRVCLYLLHHGTDEQKTRFLPGLASGEIRVAHAYHEQGTPELHQFRTEVVDREGELRLSGRKHWCTNAAEADLIVVIARRESRGTIAALVEPSRPGVQVGNELPRPGVQGVSLRPVDFHDVYLDPARDLVGGDQTTVDDFIARFEPGSSLGFAARAVGAGQAAIDDLTAYLHRRPVADSAQALLSFRYAEVRTRFAAMEAVLSRAFGASPPSTAEAHMTKVFCTTELQTLVSACMMLKGGASYADASTVMSRVYRDAASLMLIDTPNDTLLSKIGQDLLDSTST